MEKYLNFKKRLLTEDSIILDFIENEDTIKEVETLASELLGNKQIGLLEELFSILYDKLLIYQVEHNKRVHKGIPLYYIGIARYNLKNPGADRFFLLAYIEDCISYLKIKDFENPKKLPAYLFLRYTLNISEFDFAEIQTKLNDDYFYPEDVFNEINRDLWLTNDVLFDINKVYYKKLRDNLDKISSEYSAASKVQKGKLSTKVGKSFEDFCHYLFNSVNGFKVISKNIKSGVHEIDRVVENYSNNPLLKKFGQYIVIECKNNTWRSKSKTKPGVPVMDHLLATMRRTNCNMGILITKSGYASTVRMAAYLEFLKSDNMILLLDGSDLERIEKGENFVNILLEKYNELKFYKV